jgi:hypothetical protein
MDRIALLFIVLTATLRAAAPADESALERRDRAGQGDRVR